MVAGGLQEDNRSYSERLADALGISGEHQPVTVDTSKLEPIRLDISADDLLKTMPQLNITAQSGDSISTILGTSGPTAIGAFMRANGLTNSTIYAGQDYVLPGEGDYAAPGVQALGQGTLNTDNARLNAIADAELANASAQLDRAMVKLNQMGGSATEFAAGRAGPINQISSSNGSTDWEFISNLAEFGSDTVDGWMPAKTLGLGLRSVNSSAAELRLFGRMIGDTGKGFGVLGYGLTAISDLAGAQARIDAGADPRVAYTQAVGHTAAVAANSETWALLGGGIGAAGGPFAPATIPAGAVIGGVVGGRITDTNIPDEAKILFPPLMAGDLAKGWTEIISGWMFGRK